MEFLLRRVGTEDLPAFKREMQEAFQQGTEDVFGKTEQTILPERDIDCSLSKAGAVAYEAVEDGVRSGGTVVVIDEKTGRNELELLYVRKDLQSRGTGKRIWQALEKLYPQTRVWETFTPYFEKRNIHFYINCLGFHAAEFFNPHHRDENLPADMIGGDYFFRFEKKMKG